MTPESLEVFCGGALVAILAGWTAVALSKRLYSNLRAKTVVDRTLSERSSDDEPGLLMVQVAGYVLVIAVATLAVVIAAITMLQVLFAPVLTES